jgi:ribosomal protein L32
LSGVQKTQSSLASGKRFGPEWYFGVAPMHSSFHFSLLENGLDFLLSSLEHLTQASGRGDQKRSLKYALLHLCSGIELIFKERLRQEHWSLVFKDVNKADKQAYEAGDFPSVTFQEAQDRLTGICGIEISDKQHRQLKNLRDRRNQLEHFGALDSRPAVMASVSSMVSFVIDFVESAFEPKQLAEERDLLQQIRAGLGGCEAFVTQRWEEIRQDVERFDTVVECPTCGEEAFVIYDATVKCRFCNHASDPKEAADEYITGVLGHSRYESVKDGGGFWPLHNCPECDCEALVEQTPLEDGSQAFICFNCGEQWALGHLEECSSCGRVYQPHQPEDPGICQECWRYKVEKD